jgi:hypothetical protein
MQHFLFGAPTQKSDVQNGFLTAYHNVYRMHWGLHSISIGPLQSTDGNIPAMQLLFEIPDAGNEIIPGSLNYIDDVVFAREQ